MTMMSAAPAPIGRCGRAIASINADEIESKLGSPSGHVGELPVIVVNDNLEIADGEIARTIAGLEGQPPSGLIVTADYFVSSQKELIITLAARHRVAAIYPWREISGGLMSYSLGEPL